MGAHGRMILQVVFLLPFLFDPGRLNAYCMVQEIEFGRTPRVAILGLPGKKKTALLMVACHPATPPKKNEKGGVTNGLTMA